MCVVSAAGVRYVDYVLCEVQALGISEALALCDMQLHITSTAALFVSGLGLPGCRGFFVFVFVVFGQFSTSNRRATTAQRPAVAGGRREPGGDMPRAPLLVPLPSAASAASGSAH
jgi:hypothetical protein